MNEENMNEEFKVGDIVIGKNERRYTITKKGWIGIVVGVFSTKIRLTGVDKNNSKPILVSFTVDKIDFEICRDSKKILELIDFAEYNTQKPLYSFSFNENDYEDLKKALSVAMEIQDSKKPYEEGFKPCFLVHRCGKVLKEEDLINYNGKFFCKDCFEKHKQVCSFCNEASLTILDTRLKADDDGKLICKNCIEEAKGNFESEYSTLYDYSSGPDTIYFSKDKKGVFKGFGIELEMEHDDCTRIDYDDDDYDDAYEEDSYERRKLLKALAKIGGGRYYFKQDSSLNDYSGFELVTHPHTKKELFEGIDWENILKTCVSRGFRSHDSDSSCGLHMHISKAFFGDSKDEKEDNISKFAYFFEKFHKDVFKVSRRTRNDADQWAGKLLDGNNGSRVDEIIGQESTLKNGIKELVKNVEKGDSSGLRRYCAVNLLPEQTVEVRIMRGTLNYDTFMATLDFIITVAENSLKITDEELDDTSKWLEGINDNTIEYLKKRRAFGYTNE